MSRVNALSYFAKLVSTHTETRTTTAILMSMEQGQPKPNKSG